MANYYEILKVSSTATGPEIESALDAQYNQWRKLITHHDPNIVNQANQALQVIEQMRATLADPAKRAVYDAGLGIGGVSGLADPEVVLRMATAMPTPPAPRPSVGASTGAVQRTDAWICPKCNTANTIGTKFCKQCGQALGRDCPKCGKLTEALAPFCSECGVNIDEYSRTTLVRLQEIDQELTALNQQLSTLKLPAGAAGSNPLVVLVLGGGFLLFGICSLSAFSTRGSEGGGVLLCLVSIAVLVAAYSYMQNSSKKVKESTSVREEYQQRTATITAAIKQLSQERDDLKAV